MKKLMLLALLCLGNAAAQTTFDVDEPTDSLRAPFSIEVTYSGVLQLETINATTGKPVVTGIALKLPAINFVSDSVLLFNLVGSKTVAATISGVRGTFTAVPVAASGWEQIAPWGVRKKFATPVLLPAGQFLGCRYDMPMQKFTIQSAAATSWTTVVNVVSVLFGGPVQQAKMTWTQVKGNLRCKVGMKAADIPAPDAAPPPVADLIPPTVSIIAPVAGATIAGTNPLTASASDNVGVVGVQFLIDGANFSAEITAPPYTTVWNSTTVADGAHTVSVRARDAAGNTATSAPVSVTVSNAPAPPAGVSPDGSKITAASGGSLTTAAGVWTFGTATGAGGNAILLNGAQAASGEATELYVLNGGGLYAFNTFANWFQWSGAGWNRLPAAPPGAPHP